MWSTGKGNRGNDERVTMNDERVGRYRSSFLYLSDRRSPGPYSYNPNTPYMLDMESKLIFIATYNESTGEGFVYRCNIDPTTGVIYRSTEVKYKGFGKVKAMAHKAPNTNKG